MTMSLSFPPLRGPNNQQLPSPSASPSVPSSLWGNSKRSSMSSSRSTKRLSYLPVLQLLLLPMLLVLSLQTPTAQAQIDVGGFVNPVQCLSSLYEADAVRTGGDNNGVIDRDEYVAFAKLQGPTGFLDGIDFYIDLPAPFQLAFTSLACLCNNPSYGGNATDVGCCQGLAAGIKIPVDPMNVEADSLYLYVICARTDAATEVVINSRTPTRAPTRPPTLAPTLAPTLPPTLAPTLRPTPGPTLRPTPGPTFAPTLAPTLRPTVRPTFGPTLAPTETPSSAPIVPGDPTRAPVTGTPSVVPTAQPTAQPTTRSPTVPPTLAPTRVPTQQVTFSPTFTPAPTSAPVSAAPTGAPTQTPPLQSLATVVYQIAVVPGTAEVDILSDLQVAMNELAAQVGLETFPAGEAGDRRRRLAVTVEIPTGFGLVETIDCAVDFGRVTDENDLCQEVSSEILISLTEDDRIREVEHTDTYESNLFQAIFSGRLQEIMDEFFPGAPVSILTGTGEDPTNPPNTGDENLSPGATAGIAMAILLLALVPITIFLIRRQRAPPEHKNDYEPYEAADGENDISDLHKESSISVYTDDALPDSATVGVAATLGASQADYGKAKVSRSAFEAMEAGEDLVAEPGMDVAPDSSSNAGSSGWSSSAGISSMNTGSMDESADMAAAAGIGMGLAAIGATSALSRKIDSDKRGEVADDVPIVPDPSRDQLDNLIESGDWAAVGATAALLAAASDSQSASTRSRGTSRDSSRDDSIDAARASELDHLVDAGDWEGVVLAAAKFEASEAGRSDKSGTNSSVGSAGSDSGTGTGTLGTGGSPSESNISENPSMAAKRAELRGEVEALVRRVVPEEIDNVDEMMNQFKGREEELVETLRTMQERAVAQKARTAGHKAAKTEARRSVQRGVVPGSSPTPQPPPPMSAATMIAGLAAVAADGGDGTFEDSQSSNLTGGSGTEPSAAQHRSALEMAIESGDWEAVGQAAAMMEDASVGTASTGTDLNVSRTSSGISGNTANRAAELDELIDQGDWTGVVAAAAQFKQDDTKPKAKSNVSKEEEDALAQAELWTKIAEEKKKGATDAGASDAAEWAISRSLSQMKEKEAEEQQQKDDDANDNDDEEDEV